MPALPPPAVLALFVFPSVLHEAISTGDPEIVHMVLQHRDYQQTSTTLGGVPELLQKISEVNREPGTGRCVLCAGLSPIFSRCA